MDVTQAGAGGARVTAPSTPCPLTMKDVLDLEDPAADVKGYVYERPPSSSTSGDTRGTGERGGAMSRRGDDHTVRVAELRPARR